ncbi:MAG: hypothetical protein KDK30_18360, partial [Leptospiraceae bacterium]|nr:hypothetical protein [Leptospiraceae bacterium]
MKNLIPDFIQRQFKQSLPGGQLSAYVLRCHFDDSLRPAARRPGQPVDMSDVIARAHAFFPYL